MGKSEIKSCTPISNLYAKKTKSVSQILNLEITATLKSFKAESQIFSVFHKLYIKCIFKTRKPSVAINH